MQFDLPKEKSSIIKVIGVGGGGSNAVNYMFNQGIQGVNFVICNTDAQALELSPVPNKIQLGPNLTEGRGAGSKPEVGREATEESIEEIKEILEVNTKMVFITAGMGGGTGTGGAPIVARAAKEMGVLTVGIVTVPFMFEGSRRKMYALEGIQELQDSVDTLIVISNEKMRQMYGNMKLSEAFAKADNILLTAAKGIAEIITVPGYINVDFEDVKTVMTNSGVAIMGTATAEGEHRALRAVEAALSSPLLSDNDIRGAKHILLNISSGTEEVLMDEIAAITDFVQEEAGFGTDIIWGNCIDETLGEKLSVTVIATGFEKDQQQKKAQAKKQEKVVRKLEDDQPKDRYRETNSLQAKDEAPVQQPQPQVSDEPKKEEPKKQDLFSFEFNVDQQADEEHFTPQEEQIAQEEITAHYQEPEQEYQQPEAQYEDEPEQEEEEMDFIFTRREQPEQSYIIHEDEETNEAEAEPEREPKKPAQWEIERKNKLRSLSTFKLNNPNSLQELESEPAYKRRRVDLDDVPHSSENNISRYTLSEKNNEEDEESGRSSVEIRRNNSFLHDNVD